MSLHCTSMILTEDRLLPHVLFALQMYFPVASLLMLVKFNHWLDITCINSSAFNFDQVTVGFGYADASQFKETLLPSIRVLLPLLTWTDI